jgi:hypothetical protein
MMVYIQKKIKNVWRTILTIDSTLAQQNLDFFCKQYCQYKFRISIDKTDDLPFKLSGLSRDEALDALCNIPLVDLTWKQGKEAFKQIIDIIEQVRKRYEH